ncbi:hypothetical protein GCM10025780_27710 [Frondihabitans cladoniiphilus]|uniref:Solute-binding protein family 5 domain-containing protein n=1 Tax=Frondihabitans cladoniiphilus TaxID=715785 RepID=A0ABP8W4Y0_9MICO
MTLAACSSSSGSTSASADKTLIIASAAAPTSFFGDAGSNVYPTYEIDTQVSSTLVKNPYAKSTQDSKALQQDYYKYSPSLATSYDISSDQKTLTFHLRKGVVSQEGNPFTADDVVWSFQQKFGNTLALFPYISSPGITAADQITKVDKYTVAFHLQTAGSANTVLSILSNITGWIWDSTLLKKHATSADPWGVAWAKAHPTVGDSYGPYKVKSYDPSTATTLVANPTYFGTKPSIKTVTYKVVADSATRANAVASGAADVAEALTPQQQADAKKAGKVQVFTLDTNTYSFAIPNATKAPFTSEAARQAFAYAIPYDQILKSVYQGRATKPTGYLDKSAAGYDGDGLPQFSYDPAKSKELLAQAGYPDGVDITLTVNADVPDLVAAAIQMQAAAKGTGFTIKIDQQPSAAFAAGQSSGGFQIFLLRDYAITLSPPYELGLYTGKGSPINYSKWEDPTFYSLLKTATDLGDPLTPEAGKAYNAAEKYMLENAATMINYANVQPSFLVGSNVKGWAQRSDNWLDVSQLSFSS